MGGRQRPPPSRARVRHRGCREGIAIGKNHLNRKKYLSSKNSSSSKVEPVKTFRIWSSVSELRHDCWQQQHTWYTLLHASLRSTDQRYVLTSLAHARHLDASCTRLIFLKFKTYPRYINVCTFLVNKYEFILTYSGSQVFNECIYKSSNWSDSEKHFF